MNETTHSTNVISFRCKTISIRYSEARVQLPKNNHPSLHHFATLPFALPPTTTEEVTMAIIRELALLLTRLYSNSPASAMVRAIPVHRKASTFLKLSTTRNNEFPFSPSRFLSFFFLLKSLRCSLWPYMHIVSSRGHLFPHPIP